MSLITPSTFLKEAPPRIIGIECEYDLQSDVGVGEVIKPAVVEKAGLILLNRCLDNGAGLYSDVRHLEYDTQECLGPRQAAAADIAGITVVRKIVEASGVAHRGVFRRAGFYVPAKEEKKIVTAGYHENYLIPRTISHDPLIDGLIPSHLASNMWAREGMLGGSGYIFSQKVAGIGGTPVSRVLDRSTAHGKKPMVTIRPPSSDSDVLGDEKWARLEVRFADAGQSADARYLNFATTSLVIRLIEHYGKIKSKHRLDDLEFSNPVKAAQVFAADLTLQATSRLRNGQKWTALDMQEALAIATLDLARKIEFPEDEQTASLVWLAIIDRLKASNPVACDYSGLHGKLDIAAKHFYLRSAFPEESINAFNENALAASMLWNRILPTGGAQNWWKTYVPTFVDQAEIDALVTDPPQTRAAIRSRFIRGKRRKDAGLSWAHLHTGREAVVLKDPYDYQ